MPSFAAVAGRALWMSTSAPAISRWRASRPLRREVEYHAPLPAVHGKEEGAHLLVPLRQEVAGDVTDGTLDLDHIGA